MNSELKERAEKLLEYIKSQDGNIHQHEISNYMNNQIEAQSALKEMAEDYGIISRDSQQIYISKKGEKFKSFKEYEKQEIERINKVSSSHELTNTELDKIRNILKDYPNVASKAAGSIIIAKASNKIAKESNKIAMESAKKNKTIVKWSLFVAIISALIAGFTLLILFKPSFLEIFELLR